MVTNTPGPGCFSPSLNMYSRAGAKAVGRRKKKTASLLLRKGGNTGEVSFFKRRF